MKILSKKTLKLLLIIYAPFAFSAINPNEIENIREATNKLQDSEQFSNAARCERLTAILGLDGSRFTNDARKIAELMLSDISGNNFLLVVDPALRANRGYINGLVQGYAAATKQSESSIAMGFFQILCVDDYHGGISKYKSNKDAGKR